MSKNHHKQIKYWKEKAILRLAQPRKPTGLFMNEDLVTETLEKQKEQMERFMVEVFGK